MSTIKIQKALEIHLENIVNLDKECFQDDAYGKKFWKKIINTTYTFVAIKVSNQTEKIIGVISLILINKNIKMGGSTDLFITKNNLKKCWLITTICVGKKYRKSGIGSLLIKKAINLTTQLDKKNVYPILLNVRESNFKAINFYKKHGFKQYESKDNDYYNNPKENGLIMYYTHL